MPTAYHGTAIEEQALNSFIVLSRAATAVDQAAMVLAPLPGDLTPSQFAVMEAVFHRGPMSQAEIGRKVLLSKGNITVVVANLERRGLVLREANPRDGRETVVVLSATGRDIIAGYFPQLARAFAQVFAAVEREELVRATATIKALGHAAQRFVRAAGAVRAR